MAHSANRVLCTPVLMSFRSNKWLNAQITELRWANCCSSSSLTRSSSSDTSNPGCVITPMRLLPSLQQCPSSVSHLRSVQDAASPHSLIGVEATEAHVDVPDGFCGGESQLNVGTVATPVGTQHHCSGSRHEGSAE